MTTSQSTDKSTTTDSSSAPKAERSKAPEASDAPKGAKVTKGKWNGHTIWHCDSCAETFWGEEAPSHTCKTLRRPKND